MTAKDLTIDFDQSIVRSYYAKVKVSHDPKLTGENLAREVVKALEAKGEHAGHFWEYLCKEDSPGVSTVHLGDLTSA